MDLVLGRQLGHRFLFLQNFEDNLDLQFDGIALSKRAHNVLKTPLFFCLNFPIHYTFLKTYEAKYPKATECLLKDREPLLAFYDFPAEHWIHIRTTNPIESTFATIRHRTNQSRGCVSKETILTMMFKLGLCAEKRWRKIKGFNHLTLILEGKIFKDGILEDNSKQDAA